MLRNRLLTLGNLMRLEFIFFLPLLHGDEKKNSSVFKGERPGLVLSLPPSAKAEPHPTCRSRQARGALRGTSNETNLAKPVSKRLS